MKQAFLFSSMAVAAGLVFTNLYTSIVDVPAWRHSVPDSVNTARQYFSVSNPGTFFRIFSPLNQALGLLCVLLFWNRNKRVRWLLLSAFGCYFLAEGMTFLYFYPRNEILFESTLNDAVQFKAVLQQWKLMNWVHTGVIALGTIFSALALHNSYVVEQTPRSVRNARQQANEALLAG